MFEFKIGDVIRKYRTELGISQQMLCKGICTFSTLSKIENDMMVPSKWNLEYMLERLGINSAEFVIISNKNEKEMHRLCYLFNNCIINNLELAEYVYKCMSKYYNESNKIEKQLMSFYRIQLDVKKNVIDARQALDQYLDTIRITIPEFSITAIDDNLYSRSECMIILQIVDTLMQTQKVYEAINAGKALQRYFEKDYIDKTMIENSYEILLIKLSELYQAEGRYIEALNVNQTLLEYSNKHQNIGNFLRALMNRTFIYCHLDLEWSEIDTMIIQTVSLCRIMHKESACKQFLTYLQTLLGIDVERYYSYLIRKNEGAA